MGLDQTMEKLLLNLTRCKVVTNEVHLFSKNSAPINFRSLHKSSSMEAPPRSTSSDSLKQIIANKRWVKKQTSRCVLLFFRSKLVSIFLCAIPLHLSYSHHYLVGESSKERLKSLEGRDWRILCRAVANLHVSSREQERERKATSFPFYILLLATSL